jgi:DNA-binding transcriptional MerR regulator
MAHNSEVEMPIGAVTRLTGITTHTLRKWESRYHAIEPIRTDSGRRLYTQAQVDRLLLLRDLVRQGHQISALASMSDESLRELLGAGREPDVALELDRAIVVGEGLPTRLIEDAAGREIEFVHSDAQAWLARPEFDEGERCALMVELPTIPADAVARLSALRREHFPRVVVVYGFASRKTLRSLMDAGVVCLKNSSASSELLSNLEVTADGISLLDLIDREALPSQRFSAESVARLAAMAPNLQCECPNHIAQLVMDISAFERYSMECEDQNPADRALHARLRLISAHARALFEQAIAELAEHEGLSLEEL